MFPWTTMHSQFKNCDACARWKQIASGCVSAQVVFVSSLTNLCPVVPGIATNCPVAEHAIVSNVQLAGRIDSEPARERCSAGARWAILEQLVRSDKVSPEPCSMARSPKSIDRGALRMPGPGERTLAASLMKVSWWRGRALG